MLFWLAASGLMTTSGLRWFRRIPTYSQSADRISASYMASGFAAAAAFFAIIVVYYYMEVWSMVVAYLNAHWAAGVGFGVAGLIVVMLIHPRVLNWWLEWRDRLIRRFVKHR